METADLLGFASGEPSHNSSTPPPPLSSKHTPPDQTIDLLGGDFAPMTMAHTPPNAKQTVAAAAAQQDSPTAVVALQPVGSAYAPCDVHDLLSGAPESPRATVKMAGNGVEEEKTEVEPLPPTATAAAAAETAPALAGMSKITRNASSTGTAGTGATRQPGQKRRPKIVIPQRSIGMGLDLKFEEDPSRTNLCNILAPHEYRSIVAEINDQLREVRATNMDKALMVSAPLVVPLAMFGKRQSKRSKERKVVLHDAIVHFNEEHSTLRMMWEKSPVGDYLCIVERDAAIDVPVAVNQQLPTGLE